MPRVSEQYRLAKRDHILAAARTCFARNGFHQTSMTDLLAEADMSAGAFYGYFKSKNEVITAIAEQVMDAFASEVATLLAETPAPGIDDVMIRMLGVVDHLAPTYGKLGLQVWGEAQRNNELAHIARERMLVFQEVLGGLAARAQADGQLPADVDAATAGKLVLAVLLGYLVQRLVVGDMNSQQLGATIAALSVPLASGGVARS